MADHATTAHHAQRRAAAAEAASIGASAVVVTRLLGKPVAFDWRETKDPLVLGETRDAALMRNMHVDLDTRALSARLYHMQIMVCQEGAQKLLEHAGDTADGVAWRRLLDEYKPRTAGILGDPRAALNEFEVLFRPYSALWRGHQRELEGRTGAARHHGRRPEDPPCVARLTPFELPGDTRGGAQRGDHAAGSWPRTHAYGRSRCEKQRQGQGQGQSEVTCYFCSKVGHRKPDCWSWQAAQKEKEKEKPATKKDATTERLCERVLDPVG